IPRCMIFILPLYHPMLEGLCQRMPSRGKPTRPKAKIQAAQGGGFERPVWRSPPVRRGKSISDYSDDGLFCPVVVGVVEGVVSPTVFVIKRTSTRRLSARPSLVLLVSTGLSLPNPMT